MSKLAIILIAAMLLAVVPFATAQVVWSEDFESYAVGSGLHGQGGWEGWDGDPAFDAYVSDLYAHGGTNSVEIQPPSDIVHPFTGYDSGVWELVGWIYIPLEYEGRSDFVMTNTYPASEYPHWSVDVAFDGTTDTVYWVEVPGISAPLIRGEWVQLRDVIDLDADSQTFWYGDTVLAVLPWTSVWEPGGAANIATVDLFGYTNSSSPVYYDDFTLELVVVANEQASWSHLKNLYR